MQFPHKLRRPTSPHRTEQGKVVVLEQKDRDVSLFMQHPHFLDHFRRLSRSHDLARSSSIESLDGAEGAGSSAAAARQQRQCLAAEHALRLEISLRVGKAVEIVDQGPQRSGHTLLAVSVRYTMDSPPVTSSSDRVGQLQQGHLAFESHDAVEARDQLQGFDVTEAREMPAHGEMTSDTCSAQPLDERPELMDIELKDQRKAYDEGIDVLGRPHNQIRIRLEVAGHHGITVGSKRGCQVAKTEVALVLESDQQNGSGRIAHPGRAETGVQH